MNRLQLNSKNLEALMAFSLKTQMKQLQQKLASVKQYNKEMCVCYVKTRER